MGPKLSKKTRRCSQRSFDKGSPTCLTACPEESRLAHDAVDGRVKFLRIACGCLWVVEMRRNYCGARVPVIRCPKVSQNVLSAGLREGLPHMLDSLSSRL